MHLSDRKKRGKQHAIVVAARVSPLSQMQCKEVLDALQQHHPDVTFVPHFLQTCGDKDLQTSLKEMDKTDFFTREIDQLQLQGIVRIAIHSAKDLADPLPQGLTIVALTQGVDPANSLVMAEGISFETLLPHARIGTSSVLREQLLLQMRSDLQCIDIRGNIGQRLRKLELGQIEGVVIAEAALIRLKLTQLNRIRLPGAVAQYQGQLAIVACVGDMEMLELFACLDQRRKKMKKILYFGLDPQSYLEKGEVTHYPLIRILPRFFSMPDIQKAIHDFSLFSHFIFTSQNGVETFFEHVHSAQIDQKIVTGKTYIAVGQKTAATLRQQGIEAGIIAEEETAEGVIAQLQKLNLSKAYVLWPHAALARPLIAQYLQKQNIAHHECILYDTVSHYHEPLPDLAQFDELVFPSPSIVDSFFEVFDQLPQKALITTIGPITQAHLEKKIGKKIVQK